MTNTSSEKQKLMTWKKELFTKIEEKFCSDRDSYLSTLEKTSTFLDSWILTLSNGAIAFHLNITQYQSLGMVSDLIYVTPLVCFIMTVGCTLLSNLKVKKKISNQLTYSIAFRDMLYKAVDTVDIDASKINDENLKAAFSLVAKKQSENNEFYREFKCIMNKVENNTYIFFFLGIFSSVVSFFYFNINKLLQLSISAVILFVLFLWRLDIKKIIKI